MSAGRVPRGPALPPARHSHPRAAAARAARRHSAARRRTCCKRSGRGMAISDDAMQVLQRYRWPGNVRELQNVIEQAMWFADREIDRRRPSAAHRARPPAKRCCRRASAAGRSPTTCTTRWSRAAIRSGSTSTRSSCSATSRATTCASSSSAVCGRRTATTARCCGCSAFRTSDYKRFHNFLMAHGCKVDYRSFRQGTPEPARLPRVLLPPLRTTPVAETGSTAPTEHVERAAASVN